MLSTRIMNATCLRCCLDETARILYGKELRTPVSGGGFDFCSNPNIALRVVYANKSEDTNMRY